MGMNAHPRRCLGLLLLAFAACQSAPVPDLAQNENLYTDSGYQTKLPGDRTVFVVPVADGRADAAKVAEAATQLNGRPLAWDGDGRWSRPVAEMVDEVLRRELETSEIFAEILEKPSKAQVVLTATLVTFATASVEEVAGGRSLADVGLRVVAHGPAAANGRRAVLLDQVFSERVVTAVEFRTASRHVLAGGCLRAVMTKLLQALDSKNVGRDGMPAPESEPLPGAEALPGAESKPTSGGQD